MLIDWNCLNIDWADNFLKCGTRDCRRKLLLGFDITFDIGMHSFSCLNIRSSAACGGYLCWRFVAQCIIPIGYLLAINIAKSNNATCLFYPKLCIWSKYSRISLENKNKVAKLIKSFWLDTSQNVSYIPTYLKAGRDQVKLVFHVCIPSLSGRLQFYFKMHPLPGAFNFSFCVDCFW